MLHRIVKSGRPTAIKGTNNSMDISTIIPHIEALIFASDKPLTALELTEYVNNALGFIEDRASLDQVETAIEGIKEKYDTEFYAFELKQSGGGLQFLTKAAYHKTVALINGDKFIKKLSTASLETLAIIAYKQPITKSEIESIRGVNCDYAVQKLLEKDLIIISGRNEDAVGKPLIYATSKSFMDYFGINSADDLPKISEVLIEEFTKATSVNDIMEANAEEAAALEAAGIEETIAADEALSVIDDTEATITEDVVEPSASNDIDIVTETVEDKEAEQSIEYNDALTEDVLKEATENENNREDKQEEEA